MFRHECFNYLRIAKSDIEYKQKSYPLWIAMMYLRRAQSLPWIYLYVYKNLEILSLFFDQDNSRYCSCLCFPCTL